MFPILHVAIIGVTEILAAALHKLHTLPQFVQFIQIILQPDIGEVEVSGQDLVVPIDVVLNADPIIPKVCLESKHHGLLKKISKIDDGKRKVENMA
jgi:hypothetical protein